MQGDSLSAMFTMVLRCMRRRRTTLPDPSRPTTLQLFLPRSIPRTAISMEGLLIRIESPRLAVAPQFERGGPSIRGEKNQAIGISRGGRTTKIHAIVDSKGRPLSFTVTGGQVHDSQVVEEVLNTPRAPLAVTADKAYDSEKVRQQIKDEGALPIIPNRCTALKKAYCPKRFYRRRHKIENFFCRIKDWRRIATRYDKLARNFHAATMLVGTLYWIKL
jgi:transposase